MVNRSTTNIHGRLKFLLLIATIMFVVIIPISVYNAIVVGEYSVMISGRERQCDTGGECYYVVFGRDGEVFENKDSLLRMKFDSATIQAKLLEGRRYKIRASGFRIPFFSAKPNILSVEPIDTE